MFKKIAGAALMVLAVASAVTVPAQAEPASSASASAASAASARIASFTVVKRTTEHGRTLTLWRNSTNGKVHANLSGAQRNDVLSIGNCCYPYTNYETVTGAGQSELNTGEYGNYGPSVNARLNNGQQLRL